MRYRIDWNCKEWREFSLKSEENNIPDNEWWEEYRKYHRFYVSYAEFLDQLEDVLKTIFQQDDEAVEAAFRAVTLLRKRKTKSIRFDDLEISIWEDAK